MNRQKKIRMKILASLSPPCSCSPRLWRMWFFADQLAVAYFARLKPGTNGRD